MLIHCLSIRTILQQLCPRLSPYFVPGCSIQGQCCLLSIRVPYITNRKSQNEDHAHAPRYNFQLPNCLYGRTEIRTCAPDINLDYRHLPHLTACGMRLKYFSNRLLTIQQRFTISKPLASHYPLNCRPAKTRPHLLNLLVRAYISSPDKTWSFPTKLSAGEPWLHTSWTSQPEFTVEVDTHISRLRNDFTSWSFVDPVTARRLRLTFILQQNITRFMCIE